MYVNLGSGMQIYKILFINGERAEFSDQNEQGCPEDYTNENNIQKGDKEVSENKKYYVCVVRNPT